MANMVLKILLGLLTKLVTTTFIARIAVRLLWFLSNLTKTELDNGAVDDIAEALEVYDYK